MPCDLATSPQPGISVPADLGLLIEEIRIAPQAPDWLLDIVTRLSKMCDVTSPIRRSELGDDPVY